jgi:hypothetical protein
MRTRFVFLGLVVVPQTELRTGASRREEVPAFGSTEGAHYRGAGATADDASSRRHYSIVS